MSNDDSSQKTPRYEKLAKPKLKIDKTSNINPYKIKPSALSYQITDTLNKLAQPKKKHDLNVYDYPSSSARTNTSSNTEKSVKRKLINSSEASRKIIDLEKKQNLLDSYARITATRNRRCPKRLRELSKPKKNSINSENVYGNLDKNYYHSVKNLAPKTNLTYGNQKKK